MNPRGEGVRDAPAGPAREDAAAAMALLLLFAVVATLWALAGYPIPDFGIKDEAPPEYGTTIWRDAADGDRPA